MIELIRRGASFVLAVLLVVYDALDALFGPLVRPLIRALAALRLFRRIAAAIAALPPYGALALLAVPFAVIEPFKLAALYWMAQGRLAVGLIALAGAHLASILICERIFRAARPTLLRLGWFARAYAFVTALRDRALAWVRATAAWRAGAALATRIRLAFRR
jgi:hypothetical protein